MSWPRIIAIVAVSVLLIPVAVGLAVMELGTVDRSQCDWETFEYICSEHEGSYGVACAIVLLVWAGFTWLLSRRRRAA